MSTSRTASTALVLNNINNNNKLMSPLSLLEQTSTIAAAILDQDQIQILPYGIQDIIVSIRLRSFRLIERELEKLLAQEDIRKRRMGKSYLLELTIMKKMFSLDESRYMMMDLKNALTTILSYPFVLKVLPRKTFVQLKGLRQMISIFHNTFNVLGSAACLTIPYQGLVAGHIILTETMRQLCIRKELNEQDAQWMTSRLLKEHGLWKSIEESQNQNNQALISSDVSSLSVATRSK